MKPLIIFNLKRRLFNPINLLVMLVLMLGVVFLFQADRFLPEDQNGRIIVDGSARDYYEYFKAGDLNNSYDLGGSRPARSDTVISWQNGFVIKTGTKEFTGIEDDLMTVIGNHYRASHPFMGEYIDEISHIEIRTADRDDSHEFWILWSIIYFLLLNHGSSLSGELIYEKSADVLPLLLGNVSARDHLKAKVWCGYLAPLFTGAFILVWAAINFVIRWQQDHFSGLTALAGYDGSAAGLNVDGNRMAVMVLLILSGLMLVQLTVLIMVSGLTSSQQVSAFQGLISVLLLIVYYLLMTYGDRQILNTAWAVWLSRLPLANMIFLSGRILIAEASLWEGVFGAFLNLCVLSVLISLFNNIYRRNILKRSA